MLVFVHKPIKINMPEQLTLPSSQPNQYETQIHTNFSGSPDQNIARTETAPTRTVF